jgi:hypothetical protein
LGTISFATHTGSPAINITSLEFLDPNLNPIP